MKTYRHYGSEAFDYAALKDSVTEPITPTASDKPPGLWASPVNSQLNWYDWCMREEFYTERLQTYFDFTIKEDSRILDIYEEEDIIPYIIKDPFRLSMPHHIKERRTDIGDKYNLEKLFEEYDGMELHLDDNYAALRYTIFYTWDVDSIVIWNPDIIIP